MALPLSSHTPSGSTGNDLKAMGLRRISLEALFLVFGGQAIPWDFCGGWERDLGFGSLVKTGS